MPLNVEVEPPTTATTPRTPTPTKPVTAHCAREPEITSATTTNHQKGRKQRRKNRKFSSEFDFQNQLPVTPYESL
jgi:hypothetical protein